MNYLYHLKPKDLRGNILYPLNKLKDKHPDLYEKEVLKYVGREYITQQKIPILNCLWNDVLHFSAVHPSKIKKALIEAGRNPDFELLYFQVNPNILEPKNAIVYLYEHTDNKNKMEKEDFTPYIPSKINKYATMLKETKEYYKEKIDKNERPLLYHKIPHILYQGSLDVSNLPIIIV